MTKENAIKKLCNIDWNWFKNLSFDAQYEYLINDYILNQGYDDMCAFIEYGFNPFNYLMWKFAINNIFKENFNKAIINKLNKIKNK